MCEFLFSLQYESICPFECFGGPGPYAELCKGVVYAAAYYLLPVPHVQWCALNMENISNWCTEARLLWRKLEFLVLLHILFKESWVLTGLDWFNCVWDVKMSKSAILLSHWDPNFPTTCWWLNLLQAPILKLGNQQIWQQLGFGLLIDHHILHSPAYW